jgi:hypothetical protein
MKKIPLSQGKYALVDDADYELVSQYKWSYAPRGGYASRNAYLGGGRKAPKRKTILMHSLITGENYVDHINGNGLDNRRSNLRPCTHIENMRNTKLYANNKTGFKGVHYNKRDKKYQANIRVDKKLKALGYYPTAIEAARAYDNAAKEYFGSFARLNLQEAN